METERRPVWMGHMLTEINKKISAGVPYKRVLDFALDSLGLLIPYDRMGIAMLEGSEAEPIVRSIWLKSKIPTVNLNLNYSAPLKGSSLENVRNTKQPRILNDLIEYYAKHPTSESTKRAISDGIRSSLTCPLRIGERVIGFLFFSSTKTNTYKDAHVDTYLAIADELSMIIDYGRLKEDSTTYATQSKNLRTILHDLRAPLSVIEGFVRASLDEPWFARLDDDAKQIFEILLRNTQSMFDLLNELMEISRLDHANDHLVFENIELFEFANEMSNFGRILAEQKEIRFVSRIDGGPGVIRIEKQIMRRALQNLFSNAVKFSKRGTAIEFSVLMTERMVHFSVKDEGLGIAPEEIPKLFREFGKTATRPTEGESSTGLGLSIVKRLIELHQGQVDVTSELNKGSTFTLRIPIEPEVSDVIP